ncbi:hypothetical protein D9611_002239 [Ephemerocybe angulata]|uniref:Malate dehydrogenase n=1 Tax=Ephemerocybe angulata TaxID=980116 RepID=A0A8H5FE06_9AGAR|nr:hypothetical protein D9611_002239 [Tulosesus angulatus]
MRPSLLSNLVVAVSAFAVSANKYKPCSLDGVDIIGRLPDTITPPMAHLTLSFVTAAIGTQNYTCSPNNNYTLVGAVAEVYDISCLAKSDEFTTVQDKLIGLWKSAPVGVTPHQVTSSSPETNANPLLGYHYFVPNPLGQPGNSPKWDFTSTGAFYGNEEAFVTAARFTGDTAPTGKQDIDWVGTNAIDPAGLLAAQVYRTDTREGQPPSECRSGESPDIQVKYACKYWFYGSAVPAESGWA